MDFYFARISELYEPFFSQNQVFTLICYDVINEIADPRECIVPFLNFLQQS